jgi:precorrin-6Y C5,15-methyltransferase (decarboxylating)
MTKLYVIGIGYKPLDKRAQGIIFNSNVILASNRLSEVFKGYEQYEAVKDRVKVINNVDETIEFIKSQISTSPPNPPLNKGGHGGVVLLASGDPMFSGIGRRAVREFGKDAVEIIPDMSSVQIAFSRIKEAWDDAFLMSLHGGPDPIKRRRLPYEIKDIALLLQTNHKIAILTDKENNPSEIAKVLSLSPVAAVMYVCEKLGYEDEKITKGHPQQIAEMKFGEPNVVIVMREDERKAESPIRFGLSEDDILHSRGLITKDEMRAVAIHKLRLPQRGVLWDIGAGSGSVSIEAARLCPELKVFSIERDKEQIVNIGKNKFKFRAQNIEIIEGEAPDVLNGIPSPDRVFIGGSGDKLKEIMDYVIKKHVELIVVNAATIETLNDSIQCFESHGFNIGISEISVSRAKTLAEKRHMSAINPIFIVQGQRRMRACWRLSDREEA